MDTGNYASTISAVRRLCEAARNLPPNGPRGPHSAELVSALQEVDADLQKLQTREEALRRTEQQLTQAAWDTQLHYLRFRELFEMSPDGCLLTDTRGVIREASQAAASLLRCRKEFLLDKPLAFFVVGETRSFYAYLDRLNHEAASGQYWEVCLKPPKGTPVYVDLTAVAIPDGDNRPSGFLWLLRNMTERKLAQQTLQAEKDFANSLIETAQAIIFVLDNRGCILRSNQFLHALSGYDADQLRAHDWVDLFLPEADRAAFRTMLSEALRGGKSQGGTYGLVTKDQGIRLVAWSAQSLMPRVGEGAALLLVGHDVTEAHETQTRALKMERLAAIGRAVTTLTHESRNALQRGEVCLEILKLRLKG